jgi:hypothetical protein
MKQLSFFATADAPYYIYGLDYSQRSAGQRALHYLCHALNELGYEAYISSEVTHPGLRTPTLTRRIRKRHAEAGCTPIVVYPEIVSGNPLDGRVVARWLLNQPGHLAGDRFYDDTDLIFVYSRAFELPGFQAQVLHIPTVDTTVFNNLDNPDDGTRDLVCYYANKYLYKGERLTRHAQDALSLGQEVKLSRAQIAAILRRCRLLYIYEPTALMNEALLCGCPVCVVDSEYWRNNTGNMRFASDIGIAMSDTPEALAEAHRSVGNYAQAYARNIDLAWTQMRRFVNLTQMRVRQLPRQAIQEFTEPDALAATDSITPSYALWMAARQDIPAQGPTQKAAQGQTWFHVVIPLIEGAESMLSGTLHALAAQSHSHWRASILSTGAAPADLANHPAVDWQRLDEVQFTTAINRLAKASTSDWLYFMEAGDTLAPHAFEALAEQAARQPHCAALYGDEDALDDQGQRDRPYFKSDYAIDFHRAAAYALNAGIAVKRTTFLELSGLDPAAEGAEYYDLILRLYESRGATAIGHLADVLYHRRSDSGHGSLSLEATLAVRESALRRHLERCAAAAEIEPGTLPGTFRIRYAVPAETRVSIIVPTRNGGAYLQRCVGAILENTRYPHWELIVVDQASDAPETQEFLQLLRASDDVRLQVLDQDGDNSLPELINAGAEQARGSYLLFLSDGAAPLQTDWLDELLGYAVQPGGRCGRRKNGRRRRWPVLRRLHPWAGGATRRIARPA